MRFIDVGSGLGNSMAMAQEIWGGVGVGYETDEKRNAEALRRGFDCCLQPAIDGLRLWKDGKVDYCVINHFLEHLPGIPDVRAILRECCRVASRFVFMAGPWFDSDGDLFSHGCKIFASDWPEDHPTRVTCLDLYRAFSDFAQGWTLRLYGRQRIASTSHHYIFPIRTDVRGLKSPYRHDPAIHGDKPTGKPLSRCFWEVCAIAYAPGMREYAETWEQHEGDRIQCLYETP